MILQLTKRLPRFLNFYIQYTYFESYASTEKFVESKHNSKKVCFNNQIYYFQGFGFIHQYVTVVSLAYSHII